MEIDRPGGKSPPVQQADFVVTYPVRRERGHNIPVGQGIGLEGEEVGYDLTVDIHGTV